MKVAADFRKEAREALRGKWFLAVLVGLAASLLGVTGHDILTLQFENTQRNAEVNVNLGMRPSTAWAEVPAARWMQVHFSWRHCLM